MNTATYLPTLLVLFEISCLTRTFFITDGNFINRWNLRKSIVKRDVTVVSRNPSDPCPTIVDANRNVGANLIFGPRITGSFFGQGQSQSPDQGFKSWGGSLGAPQLGLMRGFNLGVPIGSKVLPTDCDQGSLQPAMAPQQIPTNTAAVALPQSALPGQQNTRWPTNPQQGPLSTSQVAGGPIPGIPRSALDTAPNFIPQSPTAAGLGQPPAPVVSAVQKVVNIPNANAVGGQWGTAYQPFSFN